jgi:hypothetical protein
MSTPGHSNRVIPDGGNPSTGQYDLRVNTDRVVSGGAISNPGPSSRLIPEDNILFSGNTQNEAQPHWGKTQHDLQSNWGKTQHDLQSNWGKTQNETQSLWGTYSDTSISRLSEDQVSISESDNSDFRSDSENSALINVEVINTEHEPQASSSKRQSVRPKHFDDFVLYNTKGYHDSGSKFARLAILTEHNIPVTVQEAVDCPESSQWLKAMEDELNSFESNEVWSLEVPTEGTQIVGNKWVFKKKVDIDGSILYRARLVAKGFTQTYGVDYFETFAPVVRRETLRILFSVAVNFNLKIAHLDVKTAFLHGDLSERVYMAQPDGFVIPGSEHLVCRLHKAVYGLKQAARSWNQKADRILKGDGFRNLPDEPCIYCKNTGEFLVIIALYVDDFYIFYRNEAEKSKLLRTLQTCVTIKDLGDARNCLGMEIIRNSSDGSIILKQEEYINSVLTRFNMKDCKGAHTPMDFKLKMGALPAGKQVNIPYRELIGCLLYLSVNTRPDISYAVSFLSQFNSNYTSTHWALAKRLLSYVKCTSKLGLRYVKASEPSLSLIGYADADWAGNPTDYKSYSGYCFTLDGNLISWESKKQKLAAQSSCESEYISLTEAVKESLFLREFVNDLLGCGLQCVQMFNDNMSAITLAHSLSFSARNKHLGCRKQLVRDCIQEGFISLTHMSTDLMPADILTKGLGRQKHEKCVNYLKLSVA